MGLLHTLVASGGLTLVGIGLAMVRFDEFKVARGLFWSAGILAGGADFWWQLTTTDSISTRIGTGLVVGLAIFVFLPMLLRWLTEREKKDGTPPINISQAR
jgi:hypothetical protein